MSYGIAIAPDGKTVYVSNYYQNNVSVINTTTNTVTGTLYIAFPYGVAVAPDGTKVYVVSSVGRVVFAFDTITNAMIGQPPASVIPDGYTPIGGAVSPNGKKLYVTSTNGTTGAGAYV